MNCFTLNVSKHSEKFYGLQLLLKTDSANSIIVNFDKKRLVPNEIPSAVEVLVVKMIVLTRDDCIIFITMQNQLASR